MMRVMLPDGLFRSRCSFDRGSVHEVVEVRPAVAGVRDRVVMIVGVEPRFGREVRVSVLSGEFVEVM